MHELNDLIWWTHFIAIARKLRSLIKTNKSSLGCWWCLSKIFEFLDEWISLFCTRLTDQIFGSSRALLWRSRTQCHRRENRTVAASTVRCGCVTVTGMSDICVFWVYSRNRSSLSTRPYPAVTPASLASVPRRPPSRSSLRRPHDYGNNNSYY